MATVTLTDSERMHLEERARRSGLPWKVTGAHTTSDFTIIVSYGYEMEVGPDDQEQRGKIYVTAQSDSKLGIEKLYGHKIDGDAAEALYILFMMHE